MNEHWQLLIIVLAVMAACDGLSLFANRFIVSRAIAAQKDQYREQLITAAKTCTDLAGQLKDQQAVEKQIAELNGRMNNYQSVERQLLELRADLPVSYVRKEDFIRHEVAINAKLDRIYEVLSKHNPGGC